MRPDTDVPEGLRVWPVLALLARHPWRADSDDTYRGYEKIAKAGIRNVCIHKGLWPRSLDKQFPHLAAHADVRDVAKSAKDWPQSVQMSCRSLRSSCCALESSFACWCFSSSCNTL